MKNVLFGNEVERMPDPVFRFMKVLFAFFYLFRDVRKDLVKFGIKNGDIVADWGCGTGAYIKDASKMVGHDGRVYAVDVHELSIETVRKIITRNNLSNVTPVLSDGIKADIPGNIVNIVFALDMFHMVRDTDSFLKEICRITVPGGTLYLENGHQSRRSAREKVLRSGCWKIVGEQKRFMICSPVK